MDNTEIVFQVRSLESRVSRLSLHLYQRLDEIITSFEKGDISKEEVINHIITFEGFFSIRNFEGYINDTNKETQS